MPGKFSTIEDEHKAAMRHRAAIEHSLAAVVEGVDAARADGFTVSFNIGPDPTGRIRLQSLLVSKPY